MATHHAKRRAPHNELIREHTYGPDVHLHRAHVGGRGGQGSSQGLALTSPLHFASGPGTQVRWGAPSPLGHTPGRPCPCGPGAGACQGSAAPGQGGSRGAGGCSSATSAMPTAVSWGVVDSSATAHLGRHEVERAEARDRALHARVHGQPKVSHLEHLRVGAPQGQDLSGCVRSGEVPRPRPGLGPRGKGSTKEGAARVGAHLVLSEHGVLRLDVAVHDATRVAVREGGEVRHQDTPHHIALPQPAPTPFDLVKQVPLQRSGQVQQAKGSEREARQVLCKGAGRQAGRPPPDSPLQQTPAPGTRARHLQRPHTAGAVHHPAQSQCTLSGRACFAVSSCPLTKSTMCGWAIEE